LTGTLIGTSISLSTNAVVGNALTVSGLHTQNGFSQINGGMQVYCGGGPSSPTGMLEVYNGFLKSSYFVGMLPATPNSFGANPTFTWGLGSWSNFAGGGASYDRIDNTNSYYHAYLFGTNIIGSVTAGGGLGGATNNCQFNTTSDARLKDNVRPLAAEVDIGTIIDAITPVVFEWNNSPDYPTDRGFVAQDLRAVVPEAVAKGDDDPNRRPGDDGFHPWGVDASKLVPYLIAELQSLRQRVAELEAAR
jgi:hypothetical protein